MMHWSVLAVYEGHWLSKRFKKSAWLFSLCQKCIDSFPLFQVLVPRTCRFWRLTKWWTWAWISCTIYSSQTVNGTTISSSPLSEPVRLNAVLCLCTMLKGSALRYSFHSRLFCYSLDFGRRELSSSRVWSFACGSGDVWREPETHPHLHRPPQTNHWTQDLQRYR